MNTDQKSEPTNKILRTDQEKRADAVCEALEWILPTNEPVAQVIWEYFRDGNDQLAFMLIQSASLDQIAGYVQEIQMTLAHFIDKDGDLSVFIQNPS